MRVLLDHCVPRPFGAVLVGHEARTARAMGWDGLTNGKLLAAAAKAGFEVLVTVDRSLQYQQDLGALPIPVILLRPLKSTMEFLGPMGPAVLSLIRQPLTARVYLVERGAP